MSHDEGMKVRREVLGDEHVDRATEKATDFTRDFQEFITRYAWGEIWTRPGLDRKTRSCITLTALVALNHHNELAMHVRAALRNGLTPDEIKEVLLQAAIYCGVPAANSAFAMCRAPGITASRASAISARIASSLAGGVTGSSSPAIVSVGTRTPVRRPRRSSAAMASQQAA